MLLVERTYKLAKPGIPKPRQVFVTQSRILAKKVKQYFATIDWSLEAGDICQQELSSAPEDDMIHADDVEDWYGDLPPRFSQLEDQHFPLFLTWDKVCLSPVPLTVFSFSFPYLEVM
ncbi:hypothetical protein MPER_01088 [Moniliophthora perniciosa FA553]|nr:hypothetical protein MPER_01088 [Moniliophthora perniciosa FA553]